MENASDTDGKKFNTNNPRISYITIDRNSITPSCTLDVNGYLDGADSGNIDGYGTFDVYVKRPGASDREQVADNRPDFCQYFPQGTEYWIEDIQNVGIHTFHGLKLGSAGKFSDYNSKTIHGTLGSSRQNVALVFRTNDVLRDALHLDSQNFYAYITSRDGNHQLYNNGNGNVATEAPSTSASHVWYFERLNDSNHYKISSAVDGWAFDVTEANKAPGTNLEIIPFRDNNPCQIWVCHEEDGYVEIGSIWTPCVVDCGGNNDTDTYLNIEYENDCQWFKIDKTTAPSFGEINYSAGSYTVKSGQSATINITFSGNGIQRIKGNAENSTICTSTLDSTQWSAYPGECSASYKIDGKGLGTTKFTFKLLDASGNVITAKSVTITVSGYYLDLNGLLDGEKKNNLGNYGTADVYINGVLQGSRGSTDFYKELASGTRYEIVVKAADGYKYNGLDSDSAPLSGTIAKSNINVRPSLSKATYQISYKANGGTGAPGNQTKTHGTALTLSSTKPTRTSSSAGSYKVTFNANGGSVTPASMDAARTTSYTFKNWNTKQDGSGTSYNAGASYTANAAVTLYAQWNSSTKTAEITLPTPIRGGCDFKGWATSSTASTGVTGKYTPSGNVTLYAIWAPKTYEVVFNANSGTGAPAKQIKYHGTALTLSSTKPTRADSNTGSYKITFNANGGSVTPASMDAARTTSYTFKNWNTKADGSGTSYNAGASYTADAGTTLYAQWNSSTKTAEITLPTPTRTGYSFKGWGTSSTATSGMTGKYTPTGNVTLYAVWEVSKYTVTYNANGGNGAPGNQTKTHGTALSLSSTKPTRADSSAGSYKVTLNANGGSVSPASMDAARTTSYTFKSWNTKADGSGTSYNAGASYTANAAATLYAQWNSSTKTAEITLPMPTRTGYTFNGWGTSSSSSTGVTGKYTPNGNITLYAIWQKLEPDFVLPASLSEIGDEAFEGGAFTYVRIPEGASKIGRLAFANCRNLRHVYIPASATSIDPTAFSGVRDLTIHGADGSYAEFYADKFGFNFIVD